MAGQAQLGQQFLHRWDFVGFFVDFDMREHQTGIDREGAEHLLGLGVGEFVEAAFQGLAVERHDTRGRALGRAIQVGGVLAKHLLDGLGVEPLQDIANGRMGRRTLPIDAESFVQPLPVNPEKGPQATIRIGATDHGENAKQ